MEKIVEQSLLYDFYGELLTKHQRAVYEDYVFNDIGISEIAQDRGISRQGVHDLVKRCDKILRSYEDRLKLLERFEEIKTGMVLIDDKLSKISAEAGLSEEHYKDISDIRDILKGIADKL